MKFFKFLFLIVFISSFSWAQDIRVHDQKDTYYLYCKGNKMPKLEVHELKWDANQWSIIEPIK